MSFLNNFARYKASENKTNLENCITEWLAECFRRYPTLLDDFAQKFDFEKIDDPKIDTHKKIESSIPDMMIYSQKKKQRIIIEVKWDSKETGNQLQRYHEYIDNNKKYGEKGLLIYLTKYGELNKYSKSLSWFDITCILKDTISIKGKDKDFLKVLYEFLEENNMCQIELKIEDLPSVCKGLEFSRWFYQFFNSIAQDITSKFPIKYAKEHLESQYIKFGRIGSFFKFGNNKVFYLFCGVLIETEGLGGYNDKIPLLAVWLEIDPPAKRNQYQDLEELLNKFHQKEYLNGWYYNNSYDQWQVIYRLKPLNEFNYTKDSIQMKEWILDSFKTLNSHEIISKVSNEINKSRN